MILAAAGRNPVHIILPTVDCAASVGSSPAITSMTGTLPAASSSGGTMSAQYNVGVRAQDEPTAAGGQLARATTPSGE